MPTRSTKADMRWYDLPMTWADGVRLMLAIVLIDAIANGDIIPAYLAGLAGH